MKYPGIAISFVIPTYNRRELLERSLPLLLGQRTDGLFRYEVIFVSNGSPDSTAEFLSPIAAAHPERLRFFEIQPTGGPSGPRNTGIRQARGEVVLIIDDDVVPHEDMALAHWRFHREHPEPHHAALGEVYVPEELLDDPMSLFHTFPYDEVRARDRLHYVHFWTCNLSVKRSFMLEHGMFDEYMLYFEDILTGFRLHRAGMHLHFLPEARGRHLHKLAPSGVASKGRFTGRWLYDFVERLPTPEVKHRFGIFSRDVPVSWLAKKIANRIAFRSIDNRVTHALLRALGAEDGSRSRVSDLYYYLIFRRNMLAGYYERRGERRRERTAAADQARLLLETK
ncbi:MAG: glycosyltransferase family 2 protein [Bryobacteraceae bacterium]